MYYKHKAKWLGSQNFFIFVMNTNVILFVSYYNINCVNTNVHVSFSAVEKIQTDFIETFYARNAIYTRVGTYSNKFI